MYSFEKKMADQLVDESGNRIMAIGPLHTVVPQKFHKHISKESLKCYLACEQKYGNQLQRQMHAADIPVIVREYRSTIFAEVAANLNDIGIEAVEKIHPWVLCTLIDMDGFDKVICKTRPQCTSYGKDENTESGTSASSETSQIREHFQKTSENEDSSQPNSADHVQSNSQVPALENDGAVGLSSSSDGISTVPTKWPKEKVNKLISLHAQYEPMFVKPGTKKKYVWGLIATELRSDQFDISADKVEQKWKNLTKTYRDTVDHNNKSGNAPKQCPYFDELQEVYGYRPNVKPVFTAGSSNNFDDRSASSTSSEVVEKEHPETKTSEEGRNKKLVKKMKTRQNKTDLVIGYLREMKSDLVRDQEMLLETLNKQHEDRMKNEEKKLELFSELIKAVKK